MFLRILFALAVLSEVCFGQSIIVTPGRTSFSVSGHSSKQTVKTKITEVETLKTENDRLRSELEIERKTKVKEKVVSSSRREWYLVSESWCPNCPAAKRVFLDKGWPESNVLTISEAQRRFGVSVPYVPYQFADPNWSGSSEVKSRTVEKVRSQPAQQNHSGLINTRYGWINPNTYEATHRGCNCQMCREIKAMIRSGRYQTMSIELPQETPEETILQYGSQQPSDPEIIDRMIRVLKLNENSVLLDLGCGSGDVLIAAVEHSGCRGIGIELDPNKADEARRRVLASGLANRIEILAGDALEWKQGHPFATHVVTYLHQELLDQLVPECSNVNVWVSPYHHVDGMVEEMKDVWVWRVAT